MADFDRYFYYRQNGSVDQLPFIPIPTSSSDRYEEWVEGVSRLDVFSNKFYRVPDYDWLILQANPEFMFEFDIPSGYIVRIPYPLEPALRHYEEELKKIRNF